MLSALGPCSEPSGGQWRQLQLPLAATLDVHAGSLVKGWARDSHIKMTIDDIYHGMIKCYRRNDRL